MVLSVFNDLSAFNGNPADVIADKVVINGNALALASLSWRMSE